jgi:hypothetical protein
MLFITACSSTVNANIDSNLYDDSLKLINVLYDRMESKSYNMDDETNKLFDAFDSKYNSVDNEWSKDEEKFLLLITDIKISYLENSIFQDKEHINDFYTDVKRFKKEYRVKF